MNKKTILLFLIIFFIATTSFAGFNICDSNGKLSKRGRSPIVGCLYFNDDNMAEYTRVKNLWSSIRSDFIKIVNGIVVEKSQVEKDVILQAEIDAAEASQCVSINDLSITMKDAFVAWLQIFNSKVPVQYRVTPAELKAKVIANKGLSCP